MKKNNWIKKQVQKMIRKRSSVTDEPNESNIKGNDMHINVMPNDTQNQLKAEEFSLPTPPGKYRKKFARNALEKSKNKGPKPMPVIVVTDIGADIDDTLALFVLLGAMDAVRIVAAVTSVNNGLHRGAVVRGFVRLLGVADEDIEILPSVDGCVADCYIPDSFPTAKEAALGDLSATPRRIVEICKENEDTGVILFGISALTPIAEAIKIDEKEGGNMRNIIKSVYLQGNCYMANDEAQDSDTQKFVNQPVRIIPNPLAYNFKNDMEAADLVFKYFQDLVPFTILGKFAAYKVPIRKGDFSLWTHKISAAWKETHLNSPEDVKVPNATDLLLTAKRQMKRFRSMNPEKFDSIYNVPKNLSTHELEKFDWFDKLKADFVCSHPYDPLLGLRMVEDIRKEQRKIANKLKAGNNNKIDLEAAKAPLFKDYYALNKNGHRHVILGNIPIRHSIPNSELIHDILVDHISKGLAYHGNSKYLNKIE